MSPFIIFEATLQTVTGDTEGARKKIGEFDHATLPEFDQAQITNIGDTILKHLTDGYQKALRNGTQTGFLISINRTSDEALARARKITTLKAQQFLKHQNLYAGKIDGLAGQQTKLAVSKFQSSHDLETTGILDTNTKITLADQIEVTEFEYVLASRKGTLQAYNEFISENPNSQYLQEATEKRDDLQSIENAKQAKIAEQNRLAKLEKKRKQQAAKRRQVLAELSNVSWERGDLAYLCRKKFWNLFSNWETCNARVLEVTSNKAHVEFEWSCGIGWQQGDTKWVELGQLMPRDDCDSYMHLLE